MLTIVCCLLPLHSDCLMLLLYLDVLAYISVTGPFLSGLLQRQLQHQRNLRVLTLSEQIGFDNKALLIR